MVESKKYLEIGLDPTVPQVFQLTMRSALFVLTIMSTEITTFSE